MKQIKIALTAIVLTSLLVACKDKETGKFFEIYLDFWNTTGRTPEIRFDEMKTSREIKIDFTKTFEGVAEGTSFTKVIIDNFRIVDAATNNYNIKNIDAYEYRDDIKDWKKDVEFTMTHGQSDDISVVLVLDKSNSLGTDFAKIQTFATSFIDKTFAERKNVKIGVVDFADKVDAYPLTNDAAALKNYIMASKQGQFTTLYGATDTAISMLQDDKAQSKVMIIFTDGTDNNSAATITPDYLLTRIKSDKNTYKISSFTIGLEGKGGIDQPVLAKLATNGGISQFPKNVAELEAVFDKFSKVISNVYNLQYLLNQQVIPRTKPAKLKFVIEVEQKF
jgi:Ca-activated chloride channel homolog